MANGSQVPVKVLIKDGITYTVPANVPISYEITCQGPGGGGASSSGSFVPTNPHPGGVLKLAEMARMDPTDLEIEPDSTLVVEATPSEYENFSELDRFARSSRLSERNVDIVVRIVEDE